MKYILDETVDMEIPPIKEGTNKIELKSSSIGNLGNTFYLKETLIHTNAQKNMCLWLLDQGDTFPRVVDTMAGVGLASLLFQKYLKPSVLMINDISNECANVWEINNIGNVRTTLDAKLIMENKEEWDLSMTDFNTFSAKKSVDWLVPLHNFFQKNKYMVWTDTANFGFRFTKNLQSYGISSPIEYYENLAQTISGEKGHLAAVFSHVNAAVILLKRNRSRKLAEILVNENRVPFIKQVGFML
jgi:hypothetical protein